MFRTKLREFDLFVYFLFMWGYFYVGYMLAKPSKEFVDN